ncbi:MAG TPA: STAS domain-containing protein [Solirubrobacteraceae bacterium]
MFSTQAASASTAEPSALPVVFECPRVNGDPDSVCVHVAGELDIASAPKLELALREALLLARLVVLDLRDLAFIDSSGVHAIVNASIRAQALARRLVTLRGPENVDRIFTLTGNFEQLEFARADCLEPVCVEPSRRRRSGPVRSPPVLRALSR